MNKFFGVFTFSLVASSLFAQSDWKRSTISVQSGLNGWQLIARADNLIDADTVVGAYIKATPTFGVSYDYNFAKWFGIGAHFTWNKGIIGANNLSIMVKEKNYEGAAELQLRRLNVGIRPIFHYVNNRHLDFYSAFRIGVNYIRTRIDIGTDSNITDVELIDRFLGNSWLLNRSYRSVRPTVQFTPFGLRGYITPNLGIGFETSIGATYVVAAQLNYRF